jgi:iron complex outermembrane receptor protein
VHEFGAVTGRLRLDYSHRTPIYFNALNITAPFNEAIKSPSDDNLKARISLEHIPLGAHLLEIGLWGDNLTDQENLLYGVDFGTLGFAAATFKKPRTVGIDAKFDF